MIRYILASAAVLGLLLAGGVGPVSAQTPTAPTATPAPASTDQKPAMKKDKVADTTKKRDKSDKQQAMAKSKKESSKLDEVAEKLNACQLKAQSERQSCMDQALKTK